jgi:uncharacterized protein (UPF0333 family)
MRGMNKRGAINISFGMIFSIILIVVFLAFAFYGIKKLVEVQEIALVSQFKSDLQEDIDKMWNGPQGQQPLKYRIPNKIEGICITNSEYQNLYFIPEGKFQGTIIEHVDFEKSLGKNKNLCFENNEGTISINLNKDFGENLVTISK